MILAFPFVVPGCERPTFETLAPVFRLPVVLNTHFRTVYRHIPTSYYHAQRRYKCSFPITFRSSELTAIMADILAKGKACLSCRARKSVRNLGLPHTLVLTTLLRNATVSGHPAAGALRISVLASIARNPKKRTFSKLKSLVSPIGCVFWKCEGLSLPLPLSPSILETYPHAGGRQTSSPRSRAKLCEYYRPANCPDAHPLLG